ncbi:hypothetical protein HY484_03070 [Candidatus Woesearchaeota archaeon]|nr:hypothetical protein [Candidatus Woesearchaeota archaeon]
MNYVRVTLLKRIISATKDGTLTNKHPAITEYRKRFPKSATPDIFLGDFYYKQKDYENAFKHYHSANEFTKELDLPAQDDDVIRGMLHYRIVLSAFFHYFEKPKQPDNTGLVAKLIEEGYPDAVLRYGMGRQAFTEDDFKSAINWMNQALEKKLEPDIIRIDAHYIRGISYLATDNEEQGEADLQKVIEKGNQKAQYAKEILQAFYEKKGDYKKSLEQSLSQDFSIEPEDWPPFN